MRTSRGEKEKLRERILDEALPYLKNWGSSGAPVDKIMEQVGLTSGALYSHFKSKDDLFTQVILRALDSMIAFHQQEVATHGEEALPRFIKQYLSAAHVTRTDRGCVFVALGTDMHRAKPAVRALYEQKIEHLFDVLAGGLTKGSEAQRLAEVQFVFASLVGALTFARSMQSPAAAQRILQTAKEHLLHQQSKG